MNLGVHIEEELEKYDTCIAVQRKWMIIAGFSGLNSYQEHVKYCTRGRAQGIPAAAQGEMFQTTSQPLAGEDLLRVRVSPEPWWGDPLAKPSAPSVPVGAFGKLPEEPFEATYR